MKTIYEPRLVALVLFLQCLPATAQSEYPDNLLAIKELFAKLELEAVSQDFIGVRTSAGIQTGLFPIAGTGASTQEQLQQCQNCWKVSRRHN